MNNLNSILDYLKVFNNINKRPAHEPRTMAQGGGIIGKPGGLVEPGVMYYANKVKKDTYSTLADMPVEKLRELGFTGKKYRKVGPPGKRYSLTTKEFKTWIKEQTPKAPTWRKGQGVGEKRLKKASKAKLTKTKVNQILKANSEIKNGLRVFKLPLAIVDYNTTPDSVFAKVVKGLGKDKVQIEGLKKVFNQAIEDGNYFTKDAYRKEMIVKTYMDDFAKHGQFTGEAKFNPILQEFKGKIPENAFNEINRTFKEWTKGKFEIQGLNRSTFDKHITKNLKNWKPVKDVTELKLQVDKELRFLNDLNNQPDLSLEQAKKLFDKEFKNQSYWQETSFDNRARQLYPHKIYGEGRFRKVGGVEIGERSPWLKKAYKNNLSGNFSRILAAADSFEDAGNMQMAKKYRKAANDLFGSKGIITKVGGQAEHPWFYNYGKGLFQIDSLIKGDLNNFKANNFEIPIRNLINEYDSTTKRPTLARKKAIEAEVKLRRDFLNSITDIGDGGMARNVKFDFTADPGKKITNTTPDIYQLHKTGKLDPLELQTRGTAYRDAVIKNLTEADYNIMKKGSDVMKTQRIGANQQMEILKRMGYRCSKAAGAGEDLACYLEDVKKTKAEARKGNPNALAKQRKAFDIGKKIKGFGKLLRRGVQGTLGTLGLAGPIGWGVEGIIEGGIYDYYKRQGYSDEQAFAETFTPRLAKEALEGKSTEDVPWYGGAEELIEQEKIGTRWDPSGKVNLAAKYADAKSKHDEAVEKYYEIQGSTKPTTLEQLEALQAKLAEQAKIIEALEPSIKAGTPESEAYQQAEERQSGLMDERRRAYLEKTDPKFLEREEKSFDIYARDKEGNILYEKMTSPFKKRYKEMDEWKGGREAFTIKPGEYIDWGSYGLDDEEGIKEKWRRIHEEGGMDLMDRIGIAGGVSNMAEGGIMSLKKK